MLGEVVGPCRILSELGSGGMGTVYLARTEEPVTGVEPGERVALKIVHPRLLDRPGAFKRFLREGEIGRRVDHENVVRTLDIDAANLDGQIVLYLVMEYVEGRTLRKLLEDLGTVPEALIREIGRQAAAGLAAIHDAGAVHRDIKPENILLTDDDRVRIMDLGVARLAEASVRLTAESEFTGSILYASPEQFGPEEVTDRADLYALGIVLYELATGTNPFRHEDVPRIILAHLEDRPPPLRRAASDISPFLGEVVATLLEKDPADRLDSAERLRRILEDGESSDWWRERERTVLTRESVRVEIPVRRTTAFAGREREMALLERRWAEAEAGHGGLVLLEGEAGIGKTRLVDDLVRRLRPRDLQVLYGSWSPSGGAEGLTRAFVDHLGAGDLEPSLARYLDDSFVTGFAAALRHEPAPLDKDAVRAGYRRLLAGLAAEKPVLWILDDLHFADPEVRRLALSLVPPLREARVLLLGTTRSAIPEEELAPVRRLSLVERIALARLDRSEIASLVEDFVGDRPLAERLSSVIEEKSDGVPFLAVELLRELRDKGGLREKPDGGWELTVSTQEIAAPDAVRGLVLDRLARLTEEERTAVDLAAVLGHDFEADLLARTLGIPPVRALQLLAAIERRTEIVRAEGRAYRFDHHLLQETLYAELPDALREAYHGLVAESVEAREELATRKPDEVPGDRAELFVRHALRSATPARALPLVPGAFRFLADQGRFHAAASTARRALDIPDGLEGEARYDLAGRLANILGPLGRIEEERAALEEAREIADASGDPCLAAEIRRLIGWHLRRVAAPPEEAMRLFREGLAIARRADDRLLEGAFEGCVGDMLLKLGDEEGARERFETQIRLGREHGLPQGECIGRGRLGLYYLQAGRWERAREELERQLEIALETGGLRLEAIARADLVHLAGLRGRTAEMLERLEPLIDVAHRNADFPREAQARFDRARVHAMLGDGERARREAESTQEFVLRIGYRWVEAFLHGLLADLDERDGESESAERRHREAIAILEEIGAGQSLGYLHGALGRFLLDQGRADEARAHLRTAREAGRERGLPDLEVRALGRLSRLEDGSVDELAGLFRKHEARLDLDDRMEARFRLWQSTRDASHLEEAYRLLLERRDHAPEAYRESVMTSVPLHAEIRAAAEEAGIG